MRHDMAGDPVTGLRWTRRTLAKIAHELRRMGIDVCPNTVGRLLQKMGFSLRVNHKKKSNGSRVDRDAQFACIASLRERFAAERIPLISVDTKKRELVGNFKNPGRVRDREPRSVNDHDYRSLADGVAIPYGIFDPLANSGTVYIGTTHNTADFAVDSISQWWRSEGSKRYGDSNELAILADGGGSTGSTNRAWKFGLQRKLCNRYGLTVAVAHYPPGASKWNPIEHRLFSYISSNWAGEPLLSYETILNFIRTTRTATGLRVRAHLVRKSYPCGVKITDAQMKQLNIEKDTLLPKWNYTLRPD